MRDAEVFRELAVAALSSLEASRQRIDDLNVYPVPDGDTGTNLALTVRAIEEALDELDHDDRERLAREIARAALMGARGNSGVILSQIVRGFAEVIGQAETIDSRTLARAFRSASDAAYRAVRKPVEGTMLTVIREMAEEAERHTDESPLELLHAVVAHGEDALARTREMLEILREAGVVDAGGAGLVELVRGLTAAVTGEELPPPPAGVEDVSLDAIHQELSRYRYCTVFVVEGDGIDAAALERELEQLGDSLMVVGDETALKVHLHTDDPGAALSLGVARGALEAIEIANMHRQTEQRETRLRLASEPQACALVAVVAGEGNARLFRSLGATQIVEGGQSMNPSTAEILAAIEATAAPGVIVLPNNSNVILSAEQAVQHAAKPARVVPTRSIPAGLAAAVAYDGSRGADENAAEMDKAIAAVVTGAVTVASRDVDLDGVAVRKGDYLALFEGDPIGGGADFDETAALAVEWLLAEPRGVLTILTGEDGPPPNSLVERIAAEHPGLEVEVQDGGQPHYHLLLSAE